MCSNKLREKQYFPKFCSIFIKKQYKILQKSNTWHLCETINVRPHLSEN